MPSPPSNDSYKCGLVYLALIVIMPTSMAAGWIARFITGGAASRIVGNAIAGILCLVAIVKGLENPTFFLPGTTLGLLAGRTLEEVMKTLLTLRGIKAALWLAPVAYAGQEILLRLLNPELKVPKTKPSDDNGFRRIKHDGPQNVDSGVLIGTIIGGREAYITQEELNRHIALVGTTGSGKTTTLYNFIEYNALKKQACIVIDGKGDRDFLEAAEDICARCRRHADLFAIEGDYPGYNPFATGTSTELADKIMALMDYSEEHYEKNAQTFVQILVHGLHINKIPITFENIVKHFSKKGVKELLSPGSTCVVVESDDLLTPIPASDLPIPENGHYLTLLEQIDKRAVEGLVARLGTLASGDTWEALKMRSRGFLTLSEILDKQKIVIFSLDSLKYPETARAFGRLVVGDIKAQISEHMTRRRGQRVGLLFDEFNVFASASVVDVVNKSRAAGFEALLAFQSLADIDVLDKGPEIRRQIIQNCNTLIVQRQNDPKDAEELARALGTKPSMLVTQQITTEGTTGLGSVRPEREFRVHPDQIKELRVGEAFVKRHTAKGVDVRKVWVRRTQEVRK
jgi:hypothetical protein